MRYRLLKLDRHAYRLEVDGEVVGSLKRTNGRRYWEAEISPSLERRPHPFRDCTHRFDSFGAAREWLGWPEIIDTEAPPQPRPRKRHS